MGLRGISTPPTQDGSLWIISPSSVEEIGCIHTCQGLEGEYVGVIIGPDLIVRDGKVQTDYVKRVKIDQRKSLPGIKSLYQTAPAQALAAADGIINNT